MFIGDGLLPHIYWSLNLMSSSEQLLEAMETCDDIFSNFEHFLVIVNICSTSHDRKFVGWIIELVNLVKKTFNCLSAQYLQFGILPFVCGFFIY